jgi:hypothetical protein
VAISSRSANRRKLYSFAVRVDLTGRRYCHHIRGATMFSSTRFGAAILLGAGFCVAVMRTSVAVDSVNATRRPLRIGARDWLTGIDISADRSTRVVRADTYGAYILDSALSQWRQLVATESMPVADIGEDKNAGVYEISIAPSAASLRLYMAFRGLIYRSDDRGSHWGADCIREHSNGCERRLSHGGPRRWRSTQPIRT